MRKSYGDGKRDGLRLLHVGGDQSEAVRRRRQRFSPNSGSKPAGGIAVTLPLGGGQTLGRAGGELPGNTGFLLQQRYDILEDLPV